MEGLFPFGFKDIPKLHSSQLLKIKQSFEVAASFGCEQTQMCLLSSRVSAL